MWLSALLPMLFPLVLSDRGPEIIPYEGIGEPYDSEDGCLIYDGYHMFETPKLNEVKHLMLLQMMQQNVTDSASKIIFLDDVIMARHPIRFAVSPDTVDDIKFMLSRQKVPFKVLSENIMEPLDKWEFTKNLVARELYNIKEDPRSRGVNYFMTYELMVEYLKNVSKENDNAKLLNLGQSYEGRDMLAIAINDDREDLPAVWVDAGIDPRKWMSQATALYLITYILRYEHAADAKLMRSNFRWYILPNMNPDGYVYTWLKDRFWRKTRSKQTSSCYGVDLKRNWDTADWYREIDPCSAVFGGEEPFSEIESRHVRDAILERKDDLVLYVSLQSHDRAIILPGMQDTQNHNYHYEQQLSVAQSAIDAVIKYDKDRVYSVGSSFEIKGVVPGSIIDWVHQNVSFDRASQETKSADPSLRPMIKHAYAIDLPPAPGDKDNYLQIADPPAHIFPTSKDITTTLAEMCRQLMEGTKEHRPSDEL